MAAIGKATPANMEGHLQLVKVNGRELQGLRDSGASITLIQPSLVSPNQWIRNRKIKISMAGGQITVIPMARVHLDWGQGVGKVDVGLLDGLPTSVILGNDLGQGLGSYFVGAITRSQTRTTAAGPPNASTPAICVPDRSVATIP